MYRNGRAVGVAQQADHPAHRGQRVGAGPLDAGERPAQLLRLAAGDQLGGLRLQHDAGDVVGHHVVQLPGQFQALVAAYPLGHRPAPRVEQPQSEPAGEAGQPASP